MSQPEGITEYSELVQAQFRAAQLAQYAAFAKVQKLLEERRTYGAARKEWEAARCEWDEARRHLHELRARMLETARTQEPAERPAGQAVRRAPDQGAPDKDNLFPMPWDESWRGKP